MKRIITVLMVSAGLFFGCGGEEPTPTKPPEKCTERQVVTAKKVPVLIKIFIDQNKFLEDGFVLAALNSMWREVDVRVVQVKTMAEAKAGLIYAYGNCQFPVEFGRLQMDGWSNLDSIIIDYSCFSRPGYKEKFPAAVSFALGSMMGIEPYPPFCSDGVMSERVGRMEGAMPVRLSDGDKEAFFQRTRFSDRWDYKWECLEEPKWERGEYAPADFRTVKFWADPALSALPIQSHLNRYFKVFGRSFEPADEKDAEFAVKTWDNAYTGCSPTAITYNSLREIHLKPEHGCLALTPDSELDATIVVHEVAHLFGVSHVPAWCGNAIMQPNINPGPYFTPVDVKAWQSRDLSWSVLDK